MVEKTYDGNTTATVAAGDYQLAGVLGLDQVALKNPTAGSYDTKDAGTGKTVLVEGLSLPVPPWATTGRPRPRPAARTPRRSARRFPAAPGHP